MCRRQLCCRAVPNPGRHYLENKENKINKETKRPLWFFFSLIKKFIFYFFFKSVWMILFLARKTAIIARSSTVCVNIRIFAIRNKERGRGNV